MKWTYAGVDLHKRQFTVCFMDKSERTKLCVYGVHETGFKEFQKAVHPGMEVAVEATGNAAYFYDRVAPYVKCVRVVNPSQFKVISTSVKKTDKEDAVTLAKYLKREMLPEVRMKSQEERALQSVIHTRDKLVKMRTMCKNRVHSLLNAHGVDTSREMFSSEKGLEKALGVELPETVRFEVSVLVEQIRSLNKSIATLEEKMGVLGKDISGQKNLQSIKGIGLLSATILLTSIGNIHDFPTSKQLCAYAGMVPTVKDTSDTVRHGRITKRGNKLFRTTLVQVSWQVIRYNPYLKSFYDRLKQKKGSGKAIVATARKLLEIIYNTLKNDWVFKDFANFERAA